MSTSFRAANITLAVSLVLASVHAGGQSVSSAGNPYAAVNSVDNLHSPASAENFTQRGLEYDNVAIVFSKLAVQKGSDNVKTFAQKVVDKHMGIGAGLLQDAKSMGVKSPVGLPKSYQQDYADLQKLSGEDFDKKYLDILTRAQREDYDVMKTMDSNSNVSLKAQAEHYEATLSDLNIQASKLQKKLGKS